MSFINRIARVTVFFVLFLGVSEASAVPVSYGFTATIQTTSPGPTPIGALQFGVGDTVTGIVTVDTSGTDSYAADTSQGYYQFPGYTGYFSVGGATYSLEEKTGVYEVNFPLGSPSYDSYSLYAFGGASSAYKDGALISMPLGTSLVLALAVSAPGMLASDALIGLPASYLQSRFVIALEGSLNYSWTGELTSIFAVPLPGSLPFLLLGLGALAFVARRHHLRPCSEVGENRDNRVPRYRSQTA